LCSDENDATLYLVVIAFNRYNNNKQSIILEQLVRAIGLFIKALLLLAIAIIGAMFALDNKQSLSVEFLVISGPEMSLGLWLILFLAIGAILGIVASGFIISRYRRKLTRLKKGINKT
jgi:putative membrane protein